MHLTDDTIFSYEKYTNSEGKTMYATVGYTTVYLYYAYPENIRPRISQMLVLPPFQKLGIGSKMIQVSERKGGCLSSGHFMDVCPCLPLTGHLQSVQIRRQGN